MSINYESGITISGPFFPLRKPINLNAFNPLQFLKPTNGSNGEFSTNLGFLFGNLGNL